MIDVRQKIPHRHHSIRRASVDRALAELLRKGQPLSIRVEQGIRRLFVLCGKDRNQRSHTFGPTARQKEQLSLRLDLPKSNKHRLDP